LRCASPAWFLCIAASRGRAQAAEVGNPSHDAALGQLLGADERGMRRYVLVILRAGLGRVCRPAPSATRLNGHFAKMNRLATEGKLTFAEPLGGVDGWRGCTCLP
jgi:hypothetical protein